MSQSNRTMVKITRLDYCIEFQTIARKNQYRKYVKSNHFLMTKEEVEQLLVKERIISRDIYSYLEAKRRENKLEFTFTWLESNGFEVKGYQENVAIDWVEFVDWFKSINKEYKTIEILEHKIPQIVFNSNKHLKLVLADKKLKKKFVKRLVGFLNYQHDEILFTDDFADYSFYFIVRDYVKEGVGINIGNKNSGDVIVTSIKKMVMNGGLIYHKGEGGRDGGGRDGRDEYYNGYYSVHT